MSNTTLAAIITPAVVAVALAAWITAVYHANRHPRRGGQPEVSQTAVPQRDVAGGQFRSQGGRQLMPRRDAVPDEAGEAGRPAGNAPGERQPARDEAHGADRR